MTYVVGAGIKRAMDDHNDVPRSDESDVVYADPPNGKHRISRAYGRDAEYYYLEEDNRVVRLPFE
jgi:hypothetical protein